MTQLFTIFVCMMIGFGTLYGAMISSAMIGAAKGMRRVSLFSSGFGIIASAVPILGYLSTNSAVRFLWLGAAGMGGAFLVLFLVTFIVILFALPSKKEA